MVRLEADAQPGAGGFGEASRVRAEGSEPPSRRAIMASCGTTALPPAPDVIQARAALRPGAHASRPAPPASGGRRERREGSRRHRLRRGRHDVGGARDDQLARPGPATGTAAVRQLGERTDRSLEARHDARRRSRIVGRDVTEDLSDVGERVEVMGGVLVAYERVAGLSLLDRLPDLLDLPRVQVDKFGDRLGREVGFGAPGARSVSSRVARPRRVRRAPRGSRCRSRR